MPTGLSLVTKPVPSSIEASDASASFPASNCLNNVYGRVGRSVDGNVSSELRIDLDLEQSRDIDTVAVLWHNLRSTDLVSVTTADNAAFTSNPVTANLAPITGTSGDEDREFNHMIYTLPAPVNTRYVRIVCRVQSTVHPDGFVQASRVVVGKSLDLKTGHQSVTYNVVDAGEVTVSDTGNEVADEDALIVPVIQLSFEWGTEQEYRNELRPLLRKLGQTRTVLVVQDVSDPYLQDGVGFGRPVRSSALESSRYDKWQYQLQVKSIGP